MPLRIALALLLTATALLTAQTTPLAEPIPGRFIVTVRDGLLPANPNAISASTATRVLSRQPRLGIAVVQALDPTHPEATLRTLAAQPNVLFVVQDRVVRAHALTLRPATAAATQSDADYAAAAGWAVRQVGGLGPSAATPNARGPWSVTTGKGIRIAILDSGVDPNHPDIAPNLALNLSEIDQSPVTGVPSPCDDATPLDQLGHGTWTASLAAAALGPSTGLVAGVAPSATLLNIKVLQRVPSATTSAADPTGCIAGQGAGLLSWVLQGIEDALEANAQIVSMSLGSLVDITTGDGAGLQATFDHATHAAAQAGVLLIAAAGNDGLSLDSGRYVELPVQSRDVLAIVASTNPACAENLTAGATCAPGPITRPYYSNFGATLNALAAPGGSYPSNPDPTQPSGWILGACSQGRSSTLDGPPSDSAHSFGCFNLGHTPYVQAMGTSAAAPLAAGAAALLWAAHPGWAAAAVVQTLRSSATPIPGLTTPQVNAAAALTLLHPNHILASAQR